MRKKQIKLYEIPVMDIDDMEDDVITLSGYEEGDDMEEGDDFDDMFG